MRVKSLSYILNDFYFCPKIKYLIILTEKKAESDFCGKLCIQEGLFERNQ